MEIEIFGLFGGGYRIVQTDDDTVITEVHSDEELKAHLGRHGFIESRAAKVVEDLRLQPRQVRIVLRA